MHDDKDIIRLYNEGEINQSFNLLLRKYSERLYYHIRRMASDHDDADDILQEVWVKVWKSLPTFRGDSSLYTWLYRVATNETLTYIKKKKLRSFFSLSDYESSAKSVESDPYFNGDNLQKELYLAVKKLPHRQQLIFNLKYFEEMKYEDISKVIGGSVGSLKASYHHAHSKICKYFEFND